MTNLIVVYRPTNCSNINSSRQWMRTNCADLLVSCRHQQLGYFTHFTKRRTIWAFSVDWRECRSAMGIAKRDVSASAGNFPPISTGILYAENKQAAIQQRSSANSPNSCSIDDIEAYSHFIGTRYPVMITVTPLTQSLKKGLKGLRKLCDDLATKAIFLGQTFLCLLLFLP